MTKTVIIMTIFLYKVVLLLYKVFEYKVSSLQLYPYAVGTLSTQTFCNSFEIQCTIVPLPFTSLLDDTKSYIFLCKVM